MSRVEQAPTWRAQLDLFAPRPSIPRWSELPRPVRRTIKTQLATLIRQHVSRLSHGKEAGDERAD